MESEALYRLEKAFENKVNRYTKPPTLQYLPFKTEHSLVAFDFHKCFTLQ
jgi:hypothetical protein